jgi:flavin reductase (DIM6/NTAB) family NADH-FMN oxidoreductase RutF
MTENSSAAIDSRELRNACGLFATGITVVTTEVDGDVHGMTANAFMSVSLDPPLLVISVGLKARLHDLLKQTGRYAVSILRHDQEDYSSHFAGWPVEGLEVRFERCHDYPVLPDALAYFVCKVVDAHPAGDHTLYIGQVEYLEHDAGEPVLFYSGKYRQMTPLDEE